MTQEQLFDIPQPHIFYRSTAGRRRGLVAHFCEVFDADGDVIIALEVECKRSRGLKRLMIDKAREAFMLRNYRPFGDDYFTGDVHVYYLYEL